MKSILVCSALLIAPVADAHGSCSASAYPLPVYLMPASGRASNPVPARVVQLPFFALPPGVSPPMHLPGRHFRRPRRLRWADGCWRNRAGYCVERFRRGFRW